MNIKIQSILTRFMKGAIAGAISAMIMVSLNTPSTWGDMSMLINSLALAGTFGGVTGFLLALQKWAIWND